ncbi:SRPBCC family protein [Polluticaenibacter yanchengensis]|uniref:SRPBCC domain-containing protein n=1 Tax=Polluticaenibacter yanchengensis TaxID=3014562 RepID=A0ABT4UME9_9BACT|nr:SRPBCC domain-containing protein [Chitinophagaceae bacterium LY-5]
MKFRPGCNIAMKIPVDKYSDTVAFYRDILLLDVTEISIEHPTVLKTHKVLFGHSVLWLDCIKGIEESALWLEIVTNNIDNATSYLLSNNINTHDYLEAIPENMHWIKDPAGTVMILKENIKTKNMETKYEEMADGKTIVATKTYKAPLKDVWNAWTKSEELDKWWAPKPWKAKTKSFNFSEGGQWLYAMQGPEGEEHWAIVDYLTIKDQAYFTSKDNFCDADGNVQSGMGDTHWQVSFEQDNDETTVIVKLSFQTEEDKNKLVQMGFKEGFAMCQNNLEEIL